MAKVTSHSPAAHHSSGQRRSGSVAEVQAPRVLALRPRVSVLQHLFGGGVHGNGRLTVLTGLVLIALFGVLGLTIVFIGQLLWLHLFLGLVLLGPVVLKLASTGYRFVRYYTRNTTYLLKGPPPAILRGLGPLIVLFTVGVFATGVALLFVGRNGSTAGELLLLHKITFIGWIGTTAIHVVGHLPEVLHLAGLRRTRRESEALRIALDSRLGGLLFATADSLSMPAKTDHGDGAKPAAGGAGRAIAVMIASLGGIGIALTLLSQFANWTH